jgi:hypothetical protein
MIADGDLVRDTNLCAYFTALFGCSGHRGQYFLADEGFIKQV